MVAFLIMLLYVVITPWVVPYDPNAVDFSVSYLTPTWAHPFGTDQFGRDLFLRTALGGRISIGIGFAATVAIMVIGILYGAISGFVGGWLDNGLMRILDALYGLPYLPFAIITLAIFGTVNFWTMVDRADRRVLVHDRARHARADHLAQGERLRARRARDRRALASHSLPAPAAEHARPRDRLRLPRAARTSCSARRSSRSSASASTRRTHRGARSRRTATPSTSRTRTSSSSRASRSRG